MESLFYFFSKMSRLLISPDFLLVLLLFISFVTYYKYQQFSRRLFATVLLFLIALTFLPVGEWLIYPLETKYKNNPNLPAKVDGVIMLSGGEEVLLSRAWHQTEFDRAVERNLYFLNLMRQYPNAKFVYSGGGLPNYKAYSKKLMSQFVVDSGLDPSRIIYEIKSKTSLENINNLHALLNPKNTQKWVVITSAWHMPRVKLLFNRYQWQVIPYPVDHLSQKDNLFRIKINFAENLDVFKIAIKEWIGIFVYRFFT